MNLTPAMRQYLEMKEKHRDCILLFRIGDFYEMFFEDAVTASRVLDITLTSRNKGREDSIPLCGVPHHSAAPYISKLIESGFKVAICEQMEDAKTAKTIIQREIVRIITPGLVLEPESLSAKQNNFIGSILFRDRTSAIAFVDISTGEFHVLESEDRELFLQEMLSLDLRELLVPDSLKGSKFLQPYISLSKACVVNYLSPEFFVPGDLVENYFPKLKPESHPALAGAVGSLLRYIQDTQRTDLRHINSLRWHSAKDYLFLDDGAKRNLELFSTIRDGRTEGSLIHVLDQTVTAMGGRKLRWWLNYPLVNTDEIRERLSGVAEIRDRHFSRADLRKSLSDMYDLERLGSRISMGVANARDLTALRESLSAVPVIKRILSEMRSPFIIARRKLLDELPEVVELIESAVSENPPVTLKDGGIIREGYNKELDTLISLTRDGKSWISLLEQQEKKRTGIQSLKVRFNNVFGYYIEVTKANISLVPSDYVRKQTLVNAERYVTEELKKREEEILNAEERRKELEYDLFVEVRKTVARDIRRIQKTAATIAEIDAVTSLAEVAEKNNYRMPALDSDHLMEIRDGRHPVVETMLGPSNFVSNDTLLDGERNRFLVITGPNMAGKSTYIRQVALITIMAQMGSFVPASEARIGVADRIFTRVGASDNLARGQSTFMVEMTEMATILKNATARSLILLDEVGRGTSTFDGLSIAWAVAEFINDESRLGARTLFATHYHQLTDLAVTRQGVRNYNIAVKEWQDQIIFLRKIVEGATNRSYGIQVAKLAGVPEEVIARAREILANLEKGEFDEVGMPKIARPKRQNTKRDAAQLTLFASDEDFIIHELQEINLLKMTPLDALNRISEWKERLKKK